MNKTDARKELAALESRKAELEKILAEPEVDPREWIGKLCVFNESDTSEYISILADVDPCGIFHTRYCGWRTCRPVTLADLEGKIYQPKKASRYDWSRKDIPEWVRYWTTDADGRQDWWDSRAPISDGYNSLVWSGMRSVRVAGNFDGMIAACPDWRDSLEERPEGV